MSKIFAEIEQWLDLHDSTSNKDIQRSAREYINLLKDNSLDIKSSQHERHKIMDLLKIIS